MRRWVVRKKRKDKFCAIATVIGKERLRPRRPLVSRKRGSNEQRDETAPFHAIASTAPGHDPQYTNPVRMEHRSARASRASGAHPFA
jgi:hypothetical protein